jgi:hypothetical protein
MTNEVVSVFYNEDTAETKITVKGKDEPIIIPHRLSNGQRAMAGHHFTIPYELEYSVNKDVLTTRFSTIKDALLMVYFILSAYSHVKLMRTNNVSCDVNWSVIDQSMLPFYKMYEEFKNNEEFRVIVYKSYLTHSRGLAPASSYVNDVFNYLESCLDAWLEVLESGNPINWLYAPTRRIVRALGAIIPRRYYMNRLEYLNLRLDMTPISADDASIALDATTETLMSNLLPSADESVAVN